MTRMGWRSLPLLLAVAAAACLAFVLVLESQVGPLSGPPAPPGVPTVALLLSQATADHFAAMPGATRDAYRARVESWRAMIERAGMAVHVVGDGDLEAGTVAEPVIVLPSAVVLSKRAAAALVRMVHRGRGVVVTWQLGLRRADGSWRGYAVLRRLFGLRMLAPADPPRELRFLALRGGRALSAGLPAGMRIEVQPYDPPLALGARDADAEWVRWHLLPLADDEGAVRPAAVVRTRRGRGRAVWLDFEPSAVTPAGASTAEALVRNALAWTANRPLVGLDTWPGGVRIAALFGLDTEDHFGNASAAVDALARAGAPATFFCVSRLAEADAATFTRLVAAGEIGSHTDDHKALAGQPETVQEDRLRASAAALRRLGAASVVGVRPPEEEADAATDAAAARAGYGYVAGNRDKDRAEPAISPEGLVVLPRIPRDDFEWLVKRGIVDPARLVAGVRDDLTQVRRLGGLYYFSFHTQSLGSPALRAALDALLDDTGTPDVWRARGSDIAAWWRARSGVGIRSEPRGERGVRITVTTRDALPDLGLRVFLPSFVPVLKVEGTLGPRPAFRRLLHASDPAVRLRLQSLRAGETRVVDVEFAAH